MEIRFRSAIPHVSLIPSFPSHWARCFLTSSSGAPSDGYPARCFDLTTDVTRLTSARTDINPIYTSGINVLHPSPSNSPTSLPSPAMPLYRTHITILKQIAASHPDTNAFQVPEFDPHSSQILEWHPITYSRFFADVELFAQYWTQKLSAQGIQPGSVVGVWYVQCSRSQSDHCLTFST